MTITFEQARQLVDALVRPDWDMGTFMVADYGWEDDLDYIVVVGAREHLIDGDPEFLWMDGPHIFVSKQTGDVQLRTPDEETFWRLSQMTEVGNHPPEDEQPEI